MRSQKWCLPVSPSLERDPTVSCLSSIHFKFSKWVSFPYDLGNFQNGIFALGSWVSPYRPVMSGFSVLYSYMVFWDIIPIGFHSQEFWGFISPVQNLRVEVPDVEHKPLVPQGKVLYFEIPPKFRSLYLEGEVFRFCCCRLFVCFDETMSLLFLSISVLTFYFLCRGSVSGFQIVFINSLPDHSCI